MKTDKIGDLVSVMYEKTRYYIVLEKSGRQGEHGERMYRLLSLDDGSTRMVRYSAIKTINKASYTA